MQKNGKILIQGIKSPFITPEDKILKVLIKSLKNKPLRNGDVIAITSKVVAVVQGRIKKISNKNDFDQIVKAEADQVIGGKEVTLTVKDNIFIAWAGIDRSNAEEGTAILWPEDAFGFAEEIQTALRKEYKLEKLGVIITDSCCTPLRRGVSAVVLGYSGFQGVNDLRGNKDLYGNTLKVTQQAIADSLAVAAHLVMGESDESMPFALIRNAPVTFTNEKADSKSLTIAQEECLFAPLYGNLDKGNK